jgi:hypothetical protein
MAFDMSGEQNPTDNITKEVTKPGPYNDVIGATVGAIWNDHFVTGTRYCVQHVGNDSRELGHFAQAFTLCPLGYTMNYTTCSDFLLGQWAGMNI